MAFEPGYQVSLFIGPSSSPLPGSGKRELSSSTMACQGWSGSFYVRFPALPPNPQPLQLEWMSLKSSLRGWWELFHVFREETRWAALLERVTSVSCPLAVPKHRLWWNQPHVQGWPEWIGGYALKRLLYTRWKLQNLVKSLSLTESHRTRQPRGQD